MFYSGTLAGAINVWDTNEFKIVEQFAISRATNSPVHDCAMSTIASSHCLIAG